jgi:riboflavin synthase
MFTGIIEKTAKVTNVVENRMSRRLTLAHGWPDLRNGESIAVNGVCLTVAEFTPADVSFDVIAETLDKSNLGALRVGDGVHVERALKVGDRIDGHFVQGHVDGRARLIEQKSSADEWRLVIEAPDPLAKFLAPKGSVAIDGVSLTIAALRGNIFELALIPTTLEITLLGDRPPGWLFNLETDIFSKTIVHWLERRQAGEGMGR